jgi:hypothetical protein
MDGQWCGTKHQGPEMTLAGVEMSRRTVLGMATFLAVAGPVSRSVRAAEQEALVDREPLERGAAWLQAQEAVDGGYPNIRGDVTFGATIDAVCALVALRNAGIEVETDSAVAYLQEHAAVEVESLAGGAGRVATAFVAAGLDPHDAGGVNLLAGIDENWDEASGSYGADPVANVYALFGLAAAGEEIPDEAIEALTAAQLDDGAWSFAGTTEAGSGDAVATAFVIQVLAASAHAEDQSIAGAIDYLRTVHVDGGAFAYMPGAPADGNTTALILAALTAAGEDVAGGWGDGVAALSAFQNESGAFRYTEQEPGDDIQVTTVTLLALAGGVLPVVPAG